MIVKSETDKVKAIEKIKHLDLNQGAYSVKVKKRRSRRSLDQNALLWLWMTHLEEDSEVGYTKEEWKLLFQEMFCPRLEVAMPNTGEIVTVTRGTSDLNTKEFSSLLDKIQLFSYHELGISLPDPNDYWFDTFVEQYED